MAKPVGVGGPPGGPGKSGLPIQKPKNAKETLGRLFRYIQGGLCDQQR